MSQTPTSSDFQYAAPPSKGMAVAGLVCAILGCIPGVGIIGAILGIIAMSKAKSDPQRFGGAGMGLAAAIVGGVMTLASCLLSVGVFFPAMAMARQSARSLKSNSQMRQIGVGLEQYASANKDWFPETGADLQARLAKYGVGADQFIRPGVEPGVTDSYIYVPGYHSGQAGSPAATVVLYENPKVVHWKMLNILYADGHVEPTLDSELQRVIGSTPMPQPPPAKRP